MGFMDTVKGWFNIGGVKVRLDLPSNTIAKSGNQIVGKVHLAAKNDKQVLKLTFKLLQEITTGSGDKKETKENILGELRVAETFDLKAGETKAVEFTMGYSIPETLKDKGGMLGAVGKLGAFATGEKIAYYVSADCDVKGTALDPGDKVQVVVA
jgi:sporulation-control protein spo0M